MEGVIIVAVSFRSQAWISSDPVALLVSKVLAKFRPVALLRLVQLNLHQLSCLDVCQEGTGT